MSHNRQEKVKLKVILKVIIHAEVNNNNSLNKNMYFGFSTLQILTMALLI